MEKKKMKENIIIRLERENEYHEVENLVRESFWNVYRPGCLEHYVLHQLRNDPAFVPELDFVMYRNGYKRKQVNSRYGSMEIEAPQDRKSTFEPQVVKKRQKDISDIDQKIISMYAKGMTTRQISETIEDIYGFETFESFISDVTDKILPQIEDWQNRPLDEVYPILYIDAIHYSVRDNGVIRKLAAYVILGINTEGKKEVRTINVGDNESAKYWLSVMNELKNRGVKDVLIICADGLTGIKEAIAAAFPKTEYQRCVVHQVRNTLKYVPDKDRKAFATDLKTIYQAEMKRKQCLLWIG